MSEEKKPFTISDRRHFTSEGEVRSSDADEAPAAPSADANPAPAPERAGSPSQDAAAPSGAAPSGEAPGPAAPAEGEGAASPAGERGGQYPSDFLGLLISLGAQASMLLMGGPEAEPPDLKSARAIIELLGALKEKTEGRRTPAEDQLLEGLLYELRMAFVQVTKAAGR